MFFLGRNFVSGFLCTLKYKKNPNTFKNLKKLFQKPTFFSAQPQRLVSRGLKSTAVPNGVFTGLDIRCMKYFRAKVGVKNGYLWKVAPCPRALLFRRQFLAQNCLAGAVVGCWTRDRKVAGSIPGRGAIKSTRSTQPFRLRWGSPGRAISTVTFYL